VKISIITPAFNEERLIGETLNHIHAGLAPFARRGWETEVIVCDNNSTDRTAELARNAGAKVVFEPHNQIARARNTGAAAASGDWFIFIDADSHPSPELFEDVAQQITRGDCLAGGSTVRFDGHFPFASFFAKLWNGISRGFRLLAGSFIFCQADAFRKLGGFSSELYAAEEIDLSKRLKVLARETGRRLVILHRHPLLTSSRKVHLYTLREHTAVILKSLLTWGKSWHSREKCHTWYDGRR